MTTTKIQWTNYVFNPWSGCSKVSPGCQNCYAEVNYSVKMRGVKWGPSGNRIVKAESGWKEPIGWDRMAKQAGERRRVFCASLADVFEDWQGPMKNAAGFDLWHLYPPSETWVSNPGDVQDKRLVTMNDVRARLFRLIDATPNLEWLLLTKRPENITRMWPSADMFDDDSEHKAYWPNVWLGASCENQKTLIDRWEHLSQTPAATRFLSAEPLLGPLNMTPVFDGMTMPDWVIIGGESGPGARQAHLEWFRDIIRQCKAANVPVFMKQTGQCVLTGRTSINGPSVATQAVMLKDKKGGTMSEWPADLRIREFPK